jgi:hypothetical protein
LRWAWLGHEAAEDTDGVRDVKVCGNCKVHGVQVVVVVLVGGGRFGWGLRRCLLLLDVWHWRSFVGLAS